MISKYCLNFTFHRKVTISETLYQFCPLIILKCMSYYYFTNQVRGSSLTYSVELKGMRGEEVEEPRTEWQRLWRGGDCYD